MHQTKQPAPKFKKVPHQPSRTKVIPWPVCSICGLVYLHNNLTAKAIRKGCEIEV